MSSSSSDLSEQELFVLSGGHLHCLHCHSFTLCSQLLDDANDAADSCAFVSCARDCGAVFHCCKELEHDLLCPRARTRCVNAGYGCPAEMRREDLGRHLRVCPASVVVCSAEWNRWPAAHWTDDERRRGRKKKLCGVRTRNPYAAEGQLGEREDGRKLCVVVLFY